MEKSTKIILFSAGAALLAFFLLRKKPTEIIIEESELEAADRPRPLEPVESPETPLITPPTFNPITPIDIPFNAPLNVPVFIPEAAVPIVSPSSEPQDPKLGGTLSGYYTTTPTFTTPVVTAPTFTPPPVVTEQIFTTPVVTPIFTPPTATTPIFTPPTATTPIFTPIVTTPTFTPLTRSILIRAYVSNVFSNPYSFQMSSPSQPVTLYYSKNGGPKISLGLVTNTYCFQHSVINAKDDDSITFSTDSGRKVMASQGSVCPNPTNYISEGMSSVLISNGQTQISLTIQ